MTTGVGFVGTLADCAFDIVVAQDVLEHVEQPVDLAMEIAGAVRPGGTVALANHFEPVIACHLPRTFHLLHTFRFVMRAFGLRYQGVIEGADHAQCSSSPVRSDSSD